MTSKSLIAIPALLAALVAVPALALDISIGASAGGSASFGGTSGEATASIGASGSTSINGGADGDDTTAPAKGILESTHEASVDFELAAVIDLIHKSDWTKTSFSGTSTIEATVYDLGVWVNSSNSAELEAALADNAGEIADLHYALEANAEFSGWLDSEHADATSVVAVGLAADGSLAVFTYNQ